ncbi:PREDICTED: cell adhesion molecule 1-like [Pterocles gutturalis]|uniref:cell adhesion molecule 1-like n=1 Tax=Pterocles gutturalis TaxID=240206 RepID=UPI00052864A2|nr:PREDICTED: cell adhesion molecule 1-like [Pterocles gutturalis]
MVLGYKHTNKKSLLLATDVERVLYASVNPTAGGLKSTERLKAFCSVLRILIHTSEILAAQGNLGKIQKKTLREVQKCCFQKNNNKCQRHKCCWQNLLARPPPLSPEERFLVCPTASADFPYNGQAIGDGVNRNSAIIGGVIAVVIFTILCTLVFLIRYMFRHKGTYHTNEAKGAESAESADAAIMNNDPNFTETIDESKKEWLI